MKKKIMIIAILALIAVLSGVWLLTRPEVLGNMNYTSAEPTTGTSDISFAGEVGDRIKFSFASEIENGELDIVLYDSKGNAVYELDRARELEMFFTLGESDTYTLAAEYSDFTGKYKITVYNAE